MGRASELWSEFVARRMLSVGPAGSVNIHTDQGTWRQHCMSRNVLTNGHGDVSVRKKEKEGSDGSSLGSNRVSLDDRGGNPSS